MTSSLQPEKSLTVADIAERVESVLAEATLAEKIAMMSGKGFFRQYKADGKLWGGSPYRAGGGIDRLGVPAFWFTDGPRGVARGQHRHRASRRAGQRSERGDCSGR